MAEYMNMIWDFLKLVILGIVGIFVVVYLLIKWALFGDEYEDNEEYDEYQYNDDEDLE